MSEHTWTVYTVQPDRANRRYFEVVAVTWTTEGPEDPAKSSIVAAGMTQDEAKAFAARQQRNYDSIRNLIGPK